MIMYLATFPSGNLRVFYIVMGSGFSGRPCLPVCRIWHVVCGGPTLTGTWCGPSCPQCCQTRHSFKLPQAPSQQERKSGRSRVKSPTTPLFFTSLCRLREQRKHQISAPLACEGPLVISRCPSCRVSMSCQPMMTERPGELRDHWQHCGPLDTGLLKGRQIAWEHRQNGKHDFTVGSPMYRFDQKLNGVHKMTNSSKFEVMLNFYILGVQVVHPWSQQRY